MGGRRPRPAGARQGACRSPPGRLRGHRHPHVLGRRLRAGRRRGGPCGVAAAAARARFGLRAPRPAAGGCDGRQPARLHGDDLGRGRDAARPHPHRRRGPRDRPRARLLRSAAGHLRRLAGELGGRRGGHPGRRGGLARPGHGRGDAARAARRRRRLALLRGGRARGRRAAHRHRRRRRARGAGARRGPSARDRRRRSTPSPPAAGWRSTRRRRCCARVGFRSWTADWH